MLDTDFTRRFEGFTNSGYQTTEQFKDRLLNGIKILLDGVEHSIPSNDSINKEINTLIDGIEILYNKHLDGEG